ncbi:MAG: hypothetical protein K1Y36_27780 [Blastocatellia bacterium]|nr:hypothetical protein [Blastocatellia bacterium]
MSKPNHIAKRPTWIEILPLHQLTVNPFLPKRQLALFTSFPLTKQPEPEANRPPHHHGLTDRANPGKHGENPSNWPPRPDRREPDGTTAQQNGTQRKTGLLPPQAVRKTSGQIKPTGQPVGKLTGISILVFCNNDKPTAAITGLRSGDQPAKDEC